MTRSLIATCALASLALSVGGAAHADPPNLRSFAGLLTRHPVQWFPSETISDGTVTVVVTQGLLDAARDAAVSVPELLRQFLQSNPFCDEARDFPGFDLSVPWPRLYVTMAIQDLTVLPGVAASADSHGVHFRRQLGATTRLYVTRDQETQVVIHDYRPEPAACRSIEPVS